MAQGQIDRCGNLLANGGVSFDLLANGFYGRVRPEKTIGQRLILTKEPEQKVLGLDVGTSKLAGLISCEEDDPARLFGITFKHNSRRLLKSSAVPALAGRVATPRHPREPESPSPVAKPGRNGWQTKYCG